MLQRLQHLRLGSCVTAQMSPSISALMALMSLQLSFGMYSCIFGNWVPQQRLPPPPQIVPASRHRLIANAGNDSLERLSLTSGGPEPGSSSVHRSGRHCCS